MTVEQLRKMLRAQPFTSFDIHIADGRSLPVDNPELVAIAPPGRAISVGLADGTFEIVDLLLVTSLKQRPNGSRRRGRGRQPPE